MTTTARWEALDILSGAHQVGLGKLKEMEGAIENLRGGAVAGAVVRLRELLVFFNGELRTHFFHEEDALFPALSRAIGPMGPVQVMLGEHRSLWQAIDALEEALDASERGEAGAADQALRVASHIVWALRSHIQKEDEMLFPTANTLLGEAEKREVTSRIEAGPVATGR